MTDTDMQARPEPTTPPARRGLVIEGALFLVGALVVKGLIMGSPFADGPLRHWYVQGLLVAVAVGLFWAGEHLIRRGYRRGASR